MNITKIVEEAIAKDFKDAREGLTWVAARAVSAFNAECGYAFRREWLREAEDAIRPIRYVVIQGTLEKGVERVYGVFTRKHEADRLALSIAKQADNYSSVHEVLHICTKPDETLSVAIVVTTHGIKSVTDARKLGVFPGDEGCFEVEKYVDDDICF